tara:strand:+ start:447 stop:650 length:204 start_codon:yes stop_codon:yes gene_type:complete
MPNLVFNMCDICDTIDGDYYEEMKYSKETHTFICSRGHKEDFKTHFRHNEKSELIEVISKLLKNNGE